MTQRHSYRLAGHRFCVAADDDYDVWSRLRPHYEVFADERVPAAADFVLNIDKIEKDRTDFLSENMVKIYAEEAKELGFPDFSVFRGDAGELLFVIKYRHKSEPSGWVHTNGNLDNFHIYIGKETGWFAESTLTMGAMLSFMLATTCADTLTMHASCVVKDGKAYLFLGRSGTGKSTHSRLWLKNIEGTELLNDDHPVIRIDEHGVPVAYGSPWSGKTDCYKNMHAPIGGIVKIEQAPHNRIRRLSRIEAYSKLMVSASGMTWFERLANGRHKAIEGVVAKVPFYELECLPDDEAAKICFNTIAL